MIKQIDLQAWGSHYVGPGNIILVSGTALPTFEIGPFPHGTTISLGAGKKAVVRVRARRDEQGTT